MNRIELFEAVRGRQIGELSRRDFLIKTTALLGSASAATLLLSACASNEGAFDAPVVDEAADPIVPGTDSAGGLTTGIVDYRYENETLMGYLSYQTDGGPRPIVIVIQEWWGLNPHIKEVADRYAEAGYVALAPDLYRGEVATEPNEARKLAMELTARDAVAEIGAAIAHLKAQPYTTDKVGVTGFCMGGRLVYQTAAGLPDITAGAAYYGRPITPEEGATIRAPIYTFLGTADSISADEVGALHAALDANGVDNQFQLYEGAQHAFFNDTRPAYDETAAKDAWEKTQAWFETYLS